MDLPEPETSALTAELKAIKGRIAKAAKGEAEKLTAQFNARVTHLEIRLGLTTPPTPTPPPPSPLTPEPAPTEPTANR